ncbi:MAG: 2-hydroxyacid dehydrogenase [Chitinispirillaceae bacterium]|nr:2-hydroxyacid dehydrogenase [Chitinispirillaceae bacterium]
MRCAFFDTKPYDREFFDQANDPASIEITYFDPHLNRETVRLAEGFDAVCVFVNDELSAEVIERLYRYGVRLIALRCAGYNNTDLKSAYGKLHVVRVPAYSPHAVAEHATALMLALNRKTHKAYNRTREMNFSITGLLGFDLHGKTAGIIGTGKIGRVLAQILKGFGMRVQAYDVEPDHAHALKAGFTYTTIEGIFSESDIISLHCPLTSNTTHLVNKETIAAMKDGVMIINTGRGKLINTQDLVNGLKKRKIGSAGLDVYEEESEYFFEDYSSTVLTDDVLARLMTFPNVLITSHQGFFTREALEAIAKTTLSNISDFFATGILKNEISHHQGAGRTDHSPRGMPKTARSYHPGEGGGR